MRILPKRTNASTDVGSGILGKCLDTSLITQLSPTLVARVLSSFPDEMPPKDWEFDMKTRDKLS